MEQQSLKPFSSTGKKEKLKKVPCHFLHYFTFSLLKKKNWKKIG
jgi:hypothetical protein